MIKDKAMYQFNSYDVQGYNRTLYTLETIDSNGEKETILPYLTKDVFHKLKDFMNSYPIKSLKATLPKGKHTEITITRDGSRLIINKVLRIK